MARLSEVAPGLYRGTLVVPSTAPPGMYLVRSTLTRPEGQASFFGPRFGVEAVAAPGPAPPPAVPAPGPPEPGTTRLPEWAERVADAFSWLVTAWAVAQVLMWIGLDNFVIAAAVGIALVLLVPGFLRPAQQFFRAIVLELVATLVEILEFIAQWLRGVAEYFQGNFIRAIIRILMVAAFMWIWNLALGIPAIKQLFDTIVDVAGRVTAWINDRVDWLLGQIERLRLQARGWVDDLLGKAGVIGGQIRDDILGLVDRFFAGLRRELAELRFELLSRFDVVRAALRAEIEIMGQKFPLLPDEVRRYLLGRFNAAVATEELALRRASSEAPNYPMAAAAPWELVEVAIGEVALAERGVAPVAGAQQDPLARELRRMLPEAPAYLHGWLGGEITKYEQQQARVPTTAQAIVDQSLKELRAVLAGAPPPIPDLPRELLLPPPPAPPKPEAP